MPFDLGSTELSSPDGGSFAFLAVLTAADGTPSWSRAFPTALPVMTARGVGQTGNVAYVAGQFDAAIDLGFGEHLATGQSEGTLDMYVAQILRVPP